MKDLYNKELTGAFDSIASDYNKIINSHSFVIREILISSLLEKTTPVLVDLGCGTGSLIDSNCNLFIKCIGVDSSIEMINKTKRNKNTTYHNRDILEIDYKEVANYVLSGVIEYQLDAIKWMEILTQKIPSRSNLIITFPNKHNTGRIINKFLVKFTKNNMLFSIGKFDKIHHHEFIKNEVCKTLKVLGFDIIKCHYYNISPFPIILEKKISYLTRRLQKWELNNPLSYKIPFLYSGFIIKCVKK